MERTKLRGITVAGLRLAIEAPPVLPWHWPEGALTRFATSAEGADLHVGVRVGEAKAPSSTGSARLRAIHVIRHAPEILAEPLCGASAACAVLENAFLPAHDPSGADTAVGFVANLVEVVPVIRLGFPKDDRVVRYAWGPGSVTQPRGRTPAPSAASSPHPSAPLVHAAGDLASALARPEGRRLLQGALEEGPVEIRVPSIADLP